MLRAKIKALCKDRGITVKELERRCGLSPGTIWHWGKSIPTVLSAMAVAKELGVPLEELIGDEDG